MLQSPELVNVQLHPDVFKRMENLKILIVDNINICKAIQYLPDGIKILSWPKYPFRLPSKYCPLQLVRLDMPYSRIGLEKLCKQVQLLLPPSYFFCPLFHFEMSQNIVLFLKIKIINLLMFLLYPY